jgi:hypothetical protein
MWIDYSQLFLNSVLRMALNWLRRSHQQSLPVILQVAYVLALLLGSSMSLALTGRRCTAFKSVPDRFVARPSHIVIYAPEDE